MSQGLESQFPEHKCGLYLSHNPNRDYYETVEQWAEENDAIEWVSEGQKRKAIETNEFWELQWHPDTPIGFFLTAACDLDVLLEDARRTGKREDR